MSITKEELDNAMRELREKKDKHKPSSWLNGAWLGEAQPSAPVLARHEEALLGLYDRIRDLEKALTSHRHIGDGSACKG